MTRPDSGSSDPSQNQDDAVWLDLVARLEGRAPTAATEGQAGKGAPGEVAPDDAASEDAARSGGEGLPSGGESSPPKPRFHDFDPLGLSAAAPTELSAAERQAAAAPASGIPEEQQSSAPDYDGSEDDGAFVPEEPPSLANTDPLTMLAWVGAVGGPVALLLAAMFWRSAPLVAVLGIVAAFVVSVVYLIMKLPQEKDEHDDGARI